MVKLIHLSISCIWILNYTYEASLYTQVVKTFTYHFFPCLHSFGWLAFSLFLCVMHGCMYIDPILSFFKQSFVHIPLILKNSSLIQWFEIPPSSYTKVPYVLGYISDLSILLYLIVYSCDNNMLLTLLRCLVCFNLCYYWSPYNSTFRVSLTDLECFCLQIFQLV